ncbi:MAG TPA: pantoate--beta-alanine ligase [Micropepsaceae bacterium]|jgi:pantoate--beta-alanine ligase
MNSSKRIETASDAVELRLRIRLWRNKGARIALVPTMGALHDGHLALVREAKARADKIVVSIFVNPAQFAPHEDFARYPRDMTKDRQFLETAGDADLIYAPNAKDMYPDGFATRIVMDGPAAGLESDFRPHFFGGVAMIVTKLFVQCAPDIAIFGEKDYQQLLVVKRLVKDLDLPLGIVGVATLRERDGLALSSRNVYLNAERRSAAAHLNQVLRAVAERAKSGVSIPQAEAEGGAALLNAGFDRVDYVALRDAETLAPLRAISGPARVLAAARIGNVRLIDNMAV